MTDRSIFDITIIGGGPTGLFAAFYAGLRQMSTKIIDSLEELGGQIIALYPEKYIYDMPGFPRVKAKDLVKSMVEQGTQYDCATVLGRKVMTLTQGEDGVWMLGLSDGSTHLTRTAVVTAGAGGFAPKKLPNVETGCWEDRGIHYFVRDMDRFAKRNILIVGGGDSAVDWALNLHPIARKVTLIHRRDRFRAHEGSVQDLLASPVDVNLFWEIESIEGDERVRRVSIFENRSKEKHTLEVDDVILSLGFELDLGPIKTWGLEMSARDIAVNSRMETNLPGIYAAGDIVAYPGKLKLIATGVGEAAVAVNHAKTYIDPSARTFPGHSTNMPDKIPVGAGDHGGVE